MNKRLADIFIVLVVLLFSSVGVLYFYSKKLAVVVPQQISLNVQTGTTQVLPIVQATTTTTSTVFKEVPVNFTIDGRFKAVSADEASIQKDYGDNQIFYENKDKIYFIRVSMKEGCTGSWYLDKTSLQYYSSEDLYAGCAQDFILTKPLLLEGIILSDFSLGGPLYATNLDTLKRYIVSEQKENESFVKGLMLNGVIFDIEEDTDISYLGDKKIRIGIYKRYYTKDDLVGSMPVDTTAGTPDVRKAEKIRDEIIDISPLY